MLDDIIKQEIKANTLEKLHSVDFFMFFLTIIISFDSFLLLYCNYNVLNIEYSTIINSPSIIVLFLFTYGALMVVIFPGITHLVENISYRYVKSDIEMPNPRKNVSFIALKEFADENESNYLLEIYKKNRKKRADDVRSSRLALSSFLLIIHNYFYFTYVEIKSLTTTFVKFKNIDMISFFWILVTLFLLFMWWNTFSRTFSYWYINSKALAEKVNKEKIGKLDKEEKENARKKYIAHVDL